MTAIIDIISDAACPITLRSRSSELVALLCPVLTLTDPQVDTLSRVIMDALANRKLSSSDIELIVNTEECLAWAQLPSFTSSVSLVIACLDHKARRELCCPSLRLLDNLLVSFPDASNFFVESQGLKVLFPAFMGRLSSEDEDEVCEFSASVIVHLLHYCTNISLARVKAKFRENSFEKLERLVELHAIYGPKVSEAERSILDFGYSPDKDEVQLELGNAGLRTLHSATSALANLIDSETEDVLRSLILDKGVAKSIVQWCPSEEAISRLRPILV